MPFAPALGRAMGEAPTLELRWSRDIEALLSCIQTLALLHQDDRPRTPSGEIEATIEDYAVARMLLWESLSTAAAEGLTSGLRDTIGAIATEEEVTRIQLTERVGKPKSTVCWQVKEALAREVLAERKEGRTRWLRRIGPLPRTGEVLPDVEDVEGFFFGVPAPRRSPAFLEFVHAIGKVGQDGVTAAEWAARVQQPTERTRARLDALVEAGTLWRPTADRYALRDLAMRAS